jgi:nitrogen-specific signal transduction histidine kinase
MTACSRSIILHVSVLNPPTAVMVVDHKGRILHATAKLSSLLGHQVANLTKMELNQLLPQPIC